MRSGFLFAGAMVCLALCADVARCCPYSIRDSAFIGRGYSSPYRICFTVRSDTARRKELVSWIQRAAEIWLENTNVTAQVVDLDDASNRELEEALPGGIAADRLPAAFLVSPRREALALPLAPGALSEDSVMESVAGVVESPALDALRRHIVDSWCVVLLVEGGNPEHNAAARKAIEEASRRITGESTEMGKVVTRGPHLIVVSPEDPRERVLLWSLGLANGSGGPSAATAVMLVGRGEVRGPALVASELTAQAMYEQFRMLGRSCTCTTSPLWLGGRKVPLAWGQEMEDRARDELGFDPRSPSVQSSIDIALRGVDLHAIAARERGGLEYTETYIEEGLGKNAESTAVTSGAVERGPTADILAADSSPVTVRRQIPRTSATALGSRIVRGVLAALAALTAAALTAATWVGLRRKRRRFPDWEDTEDAR